MILPRLCPLARIDIKFRLAADADISSVVVSLYRAQLGAGTSGSHSTSPGTDVASELNSVSLCGPVTLLSGLDSTGCSGHISLTAPALYESTSSRASAFYLHFFSVGSTSTGEDGAPASILGLDELSLGVFRWSTQATLADLPSHRCQLLFNNTLHQALLARASGKEGMSEGGRDGMQCSPAKQAVALDLLSWAAGMWTNQPIE